MAVQMPAANAVEIITDAGTWCVLLTDAGETTRHSFELSRSQRRSQPANIFAWAFQPSLGEMGTAVRKRHPTSKLIINE